MTDRFNIPAIKYNQTTIIEGPARFAAHPYVGTKHMQDHEVAIIGKDENPFSPNTQPAIIISKSDFRKLVAKFIVDIDPPSEHSDELKQVIESLPEYGTNLDS